MDYIWILHRDLRQSYQQKLSGFGSPVFLTTLYMRYTGDWHVDEAFLKNVLTRYCCPVLILSLTLRFPRVSKAFCSWVMQYHDAPCFYVCSTCFPGWPRYTNWTVEPMANCLLNFGQWLASEYQRPAWFPQRRTDLKGSSCSRVGGMGVGWFEHPKVNA